MEDDEESVVKPGFWLNQLGRQQRHSDGTGGEAPMLAIMLHDLGWIDVGISETSFVVRLNPGTVKAEIAASLPEALESRTPNHRIELVLIDPDARPVIIDFADAQSACAHLQTLLHNRRLADQAGDEDPDHAGGGSIWGADAFPMPAPSDLADARHYTSVLPLQREGEYGCHVDEERFMRGLAMTEWLAPLNTAGSLQDRRLVDSTPEMVSFALRSLGWIAVKRSWKLHGQSFRQTVPEIVALDPAAVGRQPMSQLIALCAEWAQLPGTVTFAWWDGVVWIRERGRPSDLADRLRGLCRIAANDEPMSLVDSVEVPIAQFLSSSGGPSADHPFAAVFRRWLDDTAKGAEGDGILRDLERLGLFQRRTKLLVVDENDDLRIARYAAGRVRLWNERTERAMEGSRLVDIPDRGLGLRVQRDLRSVQRRGEPVLHRCTGIVFASESLQMAQWSRLTVPIPHTTDRGRSMKALLSTCDLELSTTI